MGQKKPPYASRHFKHGRLLQLALIEAPKPECNALRVPVLSPPPAPSAPPFCPLCPGQGFAANSGSAAARTRFSIELPLPSDSPSDSAAFLAEVLAKLPPAAAAEAVVVCASEDTAAAAAAAVGGVVKGGKGSRVLSLQSACRSSGLLEGALVLLEPNTADVSERGGWGQGRCS